MFDTWDPLAVSGERVPDIDFFSFFKCEGCQTDLKQNLGFHSLLLSLFKMVTFGSMFSLDSLKQKRYVLLKFSTIYRIMMFKLIR